MDISMKNPPAPSKIVSANRYRVNAVFMLVATVLFIAFFQLAKHNSQVANSNLLSNDPYDATASFATVFACVAAFISVYRAFRFKTLDPFKKLVLTRTQLSVALCIVVTIFCDIIAMLRYPSLWRNTPSQPILTLLVAIMGLLGLLAVSTVLNAATNLRTRGVRKAIIFTVIAGLATAAYPDSFRQNLVGALGAILLGTLVLFILVRTWVFTLAYSEDADRERNYWWPQVFLCGLLFGGGVVLIESTTEGGLKAAAAVLFLVGGWAAVCIAYAFLAGPLGLYGSKPKLMASKPATSNRQ